MRVVLTGGTGFIGSRLCERLVFRGHEVIVLTRDASRSRDHLHPKVRVESWAEGAPRWESLVDGAAGLLNLAGESIAQRWTAGAKERIVRSRVAATERLFTAVEKAKVRPRVLVSASAVGYYGPRGDEELTEEAAPGADFLAETCLKWEEAARRFEGLGLRVVRIRTGLVLAPDGGALARMLLPFKAFAGGPLGSGRQWVSWIHRDDLVELFVFVLEHPDVSGVLNGTAPSPVTMGQLGKALGRALGRPSFLPVPEPILKVALGEMSTLLLEGQRVVPAHARSLGFSFRFPDIGPALQDLVGD